MSVDYSAIKTAVEAWVSTVAGSYLHTGDGGDPLIFWAEDAHGYVLCPYAELTLTDGGKQGRDHTSWESITGDDDTLSPRVRGNRQVIVGIEIRARDDAMTPRNAAEALRSSLDNDLIMQPLMDDGGLAFVSIDNYQTGIGVAFEGRNEAIATMSVRFQAHAETYDEDVNVERIRNAGLTNEMKTPAGDLVDPDASEELVGLDNPPPGS